MSQMLQENDAADFEIIKDESLKIKDQVMQDRAVRAAVQAELEKQEAAEAGLFMNPGAAANAQKKEEEEAGEKKKKVYVRKSGLETPKKVFNSDE